MDLQGVPLCDLTRAAREVENDLIAAASRVIKSGQFILGGEVSAFEAEVAEYLGVRHIVGVGNGTDALWLGLRAAGVQPGDAVLTTPFTFFATASSIFNAGAVPAFVDIEPETFNLDAARLKEALSSWEEQHIGMGRRLAAIVPVHLYGLAADVDAISSLATDAGVPVVEDAAQAMGSSLLGGAKVGTTGIAVCFSMFPTKNLGALGDAGCIATNDSQVAERLRMLRAHGSRAKYHHELIGTNSRIDELQAAFLRVKLRRLDEYIQARRRAAELYEELLAKVTEVGLPHAQDRSVHSFHQYTLRVPASARNRLREALAAQGIQTAIYYPIPVHLQPAVSELGYSAGDFPESERAAKEVLSLPMFPRITEEEQTHVAHHIATFFGS